MTHGTLKKIERGYKELYHRDIAHYESKTIRDIRLGVLNLNLYLNNKKRTKFVIDLNIMLISLFNSHRTRSVNRFK